MTPKVTAEKAPETQRKNKCHKQYGKVNCQGEPPGKHCLQLPQQNSSLSSNNYYHYYQDNPDHHHHQKDPSSSKQQSASAPSVIFISSPKVTFSESLRESFRDSYVPKLWSNLRKSASEISLIWKALRSDHESPPFRTNVENNVVDERDAITKSSHESNVKKRGNRKAVVTWHNYSPHQLNKQIRYGG